MILFSYMYERLKERMSTGITYPCFIFFADTHFRIDKPDWDNSGFYHVLNKVALESPLFILIGGDLIDNGKDENYQAFIELCINYTITTGIPIIPIIGNHNYYQVTNPLYKYHQYIGPDNFRLEIEGGLPDTLTIVGLNDAQPYRQVASDNIPDMKDNTCTKIWRKSNWHLFDFSHECLNQDSNFVDNLDNSQGNHIIVSMHVPPRLNPLTSALDGKIEKEYPHYAGTKKLEELVTYYRDLCMLVHGNSTTDKNDSTKWFVDTIQQSNKVEMVMTGHVHTYYWFSRLHGHQIDYVISGGGGNNNQVGSLKGFPVTKRHYIKVFFNPYSQRFEHQKINAGN